MKVYGVTGWKNNGKTILTERLVAALAGQDLRVSMIKHADHSSKPEGPRRDQKPITAIAVLVGAEFGRCRPP
ncbi:molybdopterin-guanine dinucleotide biosynthesis protein B [Roseicyclus sp.]|uniref:molybdopterin-guanine dinucleotide biosynthesis protein B n=1 Tax=Roseicyclus sp. TaxID=1914329 RepID=UPI003F6BEA30